jgi:hypothetical protein
VSRSMDDTPIYNYVAAIQGREYIVTICEGGMSQWDDLSRGNLSDRIHGEQAEGSVIEVRISDEIYLKARSMAEKEKAEEIRTGQAASPVGETAEDIAQLDRLMADFFWCHVNPSVPEPLKQSALPPVK